MLARLLVDTGAIALALGKTIQFIVEVRLYILPTVGKPGQAEGPEVEACVQVGALERSATRSISSIMRLKAALRVSMPDFRNDVLSALAAAKRVAMLS